MNLTYEQWQRRQLRRRFSFVGWTLVVYYLLMNVTVAIAMTAEIIASLIASRGVGDLMALTEEAAASGWGYILAIVVGLLILLCWKKPKFWREQIWERGKPMTAKAFFGILCIFLSCQCLYQTVVTGAEMVLNTMGYSLMEGLEALSLGSDNFSMFLYAGILAPITEEILFRGLIQKSLKPFGKKCAIFCSAFAFGIFHGNLFQTPYAFLVGLVLGYVASEYSIAWAMLLHMINNLVIADMLTRLTAGMSEITAGIIVSGIIWLFTLAAIVVFIRRHRQIKAWFAAEPWNKLYIRSFFSSWGMIVLMVLMGLSIIYTTVILINPL